MNAHDLEKATFEQAVIRSFAFLEIEYGISMVSATYVDEDPRDSYYVAKYRKGELRVDIAWAPVELGLSVLIRVETKGLGRKERSIHVEPFIEFLTNGQVVPIIPQVYPAMCIARIEKIMEAKTALFVNGYCGIMDQVASRLKEYYQAICSANCETIKRYHTWYSSHVAG